MSLALNVIVDPYNCQGIASDDCVGVSNASANVFRFEVGVIVEKFEVDPIVRTAQEPR